MWDYHDFCLGLIFLGEMFWTKNCNVFPSIGPHFRKKYFWYKYMTVKPKFSNNKKLQKCKLHWNWNLYFELTLNLESMTLKNFGSAQIKKNVFCCPYIELKQYKLFKPWYQSIWKDIVIMCQMKSCHGNHFWRQNVGKQNKVPLIFSSDYICHIKSILFWQQWWCYQPDILCYFCLKMVKIGQK